MMCTPNDARRIIRAAYGEDFKFRILSSSTTVGVRPVSDLRPTLLWKRVSRGKDSVVRIGELRRDRSGFLTTDWDWQPEVL